MPDHPLLFFPTRVSAPKKAKRGGGGKIFPKSPEEHKNRIIEQIDALERQLQQKRTWFQTNAIGTAPNTVLVLELAKPVEDFAVAAARLGYPLVGEWDGDEFDVSAKGFAASDGKGKPKKDQRVVSRVYLSSFNLTAGSEFLRMFDRWKNGGRWPHDGTTPWSHVFDCILAIRSWNAEDRLRESGLIADWRTRMEEGETTVQFEADFWFKPQSASQRQSVAIEFEKLLSKVGGSLKHHCVIDSIGYHGALGQLPISAIGDLEQIQALDFVNYDEIFELHPITQATSRDVRSREFFTIPPDHELPSSNRPPIVGLIDGVPMQNHPDLIGRVLVEDSDGIEGQSPAGERVHGTAMASLILNGDLGADDAKLKRPIKSRPVLIPLPNLHETVEGFPPDKLALDTFHRAILDLVDRTEGNQAGQAVHVINVSLGDPKRIFLRKMSPWARLLDWAAFAYRVLFVVSAGNCTSDIQLQVKNEDLSSLTPEQIQQMVLHALYVDRRHRTLLSPAEALNALTVGAIHSDRSSVSALGQRIDPFSTPELLSPLSPIGLGYKNTIKPDVLAVGGRQLYTKPLAENQNAAAIRLRIVKGMSAPGVTVAAPGSPFAGSQRWHIRGTSVAAALTTRLAAQVFDELELLPEGASAIAKGYASVLLKALVAHTASWGEAAESSLRNMLNDNGVPTRKLKEYLSRFLGHGQIRPERAYRCTDQRVTVMGYGELKHGEAHVFRFPWPPDLRAKVDERRLTVTLATIIPTVPNNYEYRGADVWVTKPAECGEVGLESGDRDHHAIERGTLQHNCYVGSKAADFVDDASLTLQVNCRAVAWDEALLPAVPYALVVSLEVPETSNIRVYEQVEIGLRAQIKLPVGG